MLYFNGAEATCTAIRTAGANRRHGTCGQMQGDRARERESERTSERVSARARERETKNEGERESERKRENQSEREREVEQAREGARASARKLLWHVRRRYLPLQESSAGAKEFGTHVTRIVVVFDDAEVRHECRVEDGRPD